MRRACFVLGIAAVFTGLLAAQEATFTAEPEATTVASGEQFRVNFVFSGSGTGAPSGFTAPDFGQLVVISGPNTSQSFQFINGAASVSITYSYVLYARQEGSVTIPAASVSFKGKTYSTQPIKLTVVKGKPAPEKKDQASQGVEIGDNILLRATADRQRVRLGEQVTVTWKVYTRVGMSISRVSKLPTFEGFWGEDFELPKQASLVNEVYEGKQYRVAVLKKTALFPSQTGRLTVSPMQVVCAVQVQSRRRSNDPFDQFFNDPFFQSFQTVEADLASNDLAITVDPLPTGAPEGFGNAVGTYSFDATVDKTELRAGDAVTLRIAVRGTGNIKLLALPKPSVPADIEAFEPTIDEKIERADGSVRGSKSAEYVLVPRNAGTRTIEPMTFSYYDPAKRSYVTLRSKAFNLNVLPGREMAMGAAGVSREDVRLLGQDIRFIKLGSGSLRPTGSSGAGGTLFLLGLVAPPLLFAGALVYRKRMEKVYGDLPSLRFERAGKEASRRLKKARTLLSQGNAEQYHAEVLRALTEYLEHKLRMPKASLGMDQVLERLRQGGVGEESLGLTRSCLERAEFARYAPGADTAEARKDLLDAATRSIGGIEKEYRSR